MAGMKYVKMIRHTKPGMAGNHWAKLYEKDGRFIVRCGVCEGTDVALTRWVPEAEREVEE